MAMAEERWIAETLFDELGFRMTFKVEKVLYEMHTEHQHLVLFEQPFFGKMLMLDGATQITKKDEFIYQEMMSHVPLFAHGNARDVLIVGGGDCGIAEEVLKHKSVRRLTQVEIDPAVVEFAKEHFSEFTKPVFADDRFESVIDDGMKYVARTERRFDAIIVNSTDPQGPGKVLFSSFPSLPCSDTRQRLVYGRSTETRITGSPPTRAAIRRLRTVEPPGTRLLPRRALSQSPFGSSSPPGVSRYSPLSTSIGLTSTARREGT